MEMGPTPVNQEYLIVSAFDIRRIQLTWRLLLDTQWANMIEI